MTNGDAAAVRSSLCFIVIILAAAALVQAGPVSLYSAMSPFGRNIRPIACKSKAGDEGVCMFAMDCTRMNGIHLGTCIDRFYFGSCCAPTSPLQAAEFGIVPSNGINNSNDLSTPTTTTTPSVISSTTGGINLNVPNELLTTINSLQPANVGSTTPSSTTATGATFPPSTTTVTSTPTTSTTTTPGTSTTLAPPPPSTTTTTTQSSTTTSTVPSTTTIPASITSTSSTEAAVTSTNAPLTSTTTASTTSTLAAATATLELIVPTTDSLESIATTIEPFLPTDATDIGTESVAELITTVQPEEESTEDTTEAVKQEATVSSPSLELVPSSSTTSSSSSTTADSTTTVSPSSSTTLPPPPPPPVSSSTSVPDVAVTTSTTTATTTSEPSVELTTAVDLGLISTTTATAAAAGNNETTEEGTLVPQNPDYRQVCGRPQYRYPTARIVGGTTTQYGQWPWQISLRQWRTATFLHKCGAALLNENWAITAAHCVDNVQPDDLLLRMGEYDLATDEEEYPYVERKVQIVASHPQFDSRTFEYDLALLRFYDPVRFQPNIVPICLPPPQPETDYVGQTAYVTGWGRLYEDGPLPSKMQQVSVPVINNTECENMYRRAGYVEHIPNIFICAGYSEGKRDSCEGDSGGPMVIHGNNTDHWVLAGVISWGIGCAEANQPGVYTRISEFREWIDKIIVF